MSMIGNLRSATDRQLKTLLAAPERIHDFLEDEDTLDDGAGAAFLELDIDKAWHGLHFLFTGTESGGEPPLDFLVSGGQEVGEEDVGYGPARAFTSAEVKQIALALEALSSEALRARFAPARMQELDIYPRIWDRPPEEDDTLGYLLSYFEELRAFTLRLAAGGQGMLVWLG
jgi:hypothetical protein